MADKILGFEGSIGEGQISDYLRTAAGPPQVLSGGAFSVVAGVDRTLRVAAHEFGAWGYRAALDTRDLQLDPVTSGSRWDTIVDRFNPNGSSPGTVTLQYVKGTATKGLAAGVKVATDDITSGFFDVVLGLARVAAGGSAGTIAEFVRFPTQASPTASLTGTELPPHTMYPAGQILVFNDTTPSNPISNQILRRTVAGWSTVYAGDGPFHPIDPLDPWQALGPCGWRFRAGWVDYWVHARRKPGIPAIGTDELGSFAGGPQVLTMTGAPQHHSVMDHIPPVQLRRPNGRSVPGVGVYSPSRIFYLLGAVPGFSLAAETELHATGSYWAGYGD